MKKHKKQLTGSLWVLSGAVLIGFLMFLKKGSQMFSNLIPKPTNTLDTTTTQLTENQITFEQTFQPTETFQPVEILQPFETTLIPEIQTIQPNTTEFITQEQTTNDESLMQTVLKTAQHTTEKEGLLSSIVKSTSKYLAEECTECHDYGTSN